jgi:hypothetical protein
VAGAVGKLQTPLEHYTYRDVSDYVTRMDRYAKLAAQEMAGKGRRPLPGELVWRPCFTFFNLFFWRRGFLEGSQGYTLAVLGSQYNFLKYYYLRELSREGSPHGH